MARLAAVVSLTRSPRLPGKVPFRRGSRRFLTRSFTLAIFRRSNSLGVVQFNSFFVPIVQDGGPS